MWRWLSLDTARPPTVGAGPRERADQREGRLRFLLGHFAFEHLMDDLRNGHVALQRELMDPL